ncbi:nuclear transport factor 2 family protein [Kordiimonas aestuarii]|uniref:nuclear transport factor 2 family protein n=1 Tax=Kordiimonas aestuarii TaxID=1005925 RepID=UPI0021D35218|nr:nuclear transport factor 2 family protein [Kordiimonas aestuarii]
MRYLIAVIMLFCANATAHATDDADKVAAISATLDKFHTAASTADWGTYFGLMSEDAIFLGTDAGERWDIPTFKSYAEPTKGWTYVMQERHINLTPDGHSAWFDELLNNEKYGTSRGTGILIRTNDGWKISQYHLTFPIPNDLAAGITQQIQVFEQQQKMGQN